MFWHRTLKVKISSNLKLSVTLHKFFLESYKHLASPFPRQRTPPRPKLWNHRSFQPIIIILTIIRKITGIKLLTRRRFGSHIWNKWGRTPSKTCTSLEKRDKTRPTGVTSKKVVTGKWIILFNKDWWSNFAALSPPILLLSVCIHTLMATIKMAYYYPFLHRLTSLNTSESIIPYIPKSFTSKITC